MSEGFERLKALATGAELGELSQLSDDLDRMLCERSLYGFIKAGWKYLDPAPFVDGWHTQAVCEHLEALCRGDIRHLLINQPPRTMKSITVSVALTPWVWAQRIKASTALPTGLSTAYPQGEADPPRPPFIGSHIEMEPTPPPPRLILPNQKGSHLGPKTSFLYASYGQHLALRDSVKARRLLSSPWYKANWKHFEMLGDSNTKTRFDNTEGGYRLSTSVGGALTGEGAEVIIVDDAHNTVDIESETVREGVLQWWDEAMSTRLNDPKTGSFIVVMQRLHERDLAGHIMAKAEAGGDWTLLRLPMEYEPTYHCVTKLGWEDPRGLDGEGEVLEGLTEGTNGQLIVVPGSPMDGAAGTLLWPERFGQEEVDTLKRALGPFGASGQLQQNPVPKGGGIIKEAWWQLFPPKGEEKVWLVNQRKWDDQEQDYVEREVLNYPSMEYIVVYADTAYTEEEENDYSAAAMIGVWRDRNGNAKLMLMRAWQERMELHKLVQKLAGTCTLSKGRNPTYVDALVIENKASGKSAAQEIKRLFGNENWATILADPAHGDKVARAYSIQYLFADKMVYAPARDWADKAIAECTIFPKGQHDDLPDAIFGGIAWLRKNGYIEMRRERVIGQHEAGLFKTQGGALYDC